MRDVVLLGSSDRQTVEGHDLEKTSEVILGSPLILLLNCLTGPTQQT